MAIRVSADRTSELFDAMGTLPMQAKKQQSFGQLFSNTVK